ncbi:MAG: hypothetical protein ABW321_32180 [Polyangiales bacterium]
MDKLSSPQVNPLCADNPRLRDVPLVVGVSLTFGFVDDVLLVCHGRAPLRDDEWQRLLAYTTKPGYRSLLVSTLGGEPDRVQRHQLHARLTASPRRVPRVAVLTTSPTMRWAHIARRWIDTVDAKTFAFEEVTSASQYLGCRAAPERLARARDRARYLLEKRVLQQRVSRFLTHTH